MSEHDIEDLEERMATALQSMVDAILSRKQSQRAAVQRLVEEVVEVYNDPM